jgi:hypothetical protein
MIFAVTAQTSAFRLKATDLLSKALPFNRLINPGSLRGQCFEENAAT